MTWTGMSCCRLKHHVASGLRTGGACKDILPCLTWHCKIPDIMQLLIRASSRSRRYARVTDPNYHSGPRTRVLSTSVPYRYPVWRDFATDRTRYKRFTTVLLPRPKKMNKSGNPFLNRKQMMSRYTCSREKERVLTGRYFVLWKIKENSHSNVKEARRENCGTRLKWFTNKG